MSHWYHQKQKDLAQVRNDVQVFASAHGPPQHRPRRPAHRPAAPQAPPQDGKAHVVALLASIQRDHPVAWDRLERGEGVTVECSGAYYMLRLHQSNGEGFANLVEPGFTADFGNAIEITPVAAPSAPENTGAAFHALSLVAAGLAEVDR